MIVKGRCIETLKRKVDKRTDIAHYQNGYFEEGKMEIREFGYVDITEVLRFNVHDVTLL